MICSCPMSGVNCDKSVLALLPNDFGIISCREANERGLDYRLLDERELVELNPDMKPRTNDNHIERRYLGKTEKE